MRLSLGLAFSLVLLAMQAVAAVEVETDRFTGKVTIKTRQPPRLDTVNAHFMGSIEEGRRVVTIFLVGAWQGGWRYLNCHHTHWLADNERVAIGETTHHGSARGRTVVEQVIHMDASLEGVRRLGAATKVEFRVCNDEFELAADAHDDLREFLRRLDALSVGDTPASKLAPKGQAL